MATHSFGLLDRCEYFFCQQWMTEEDKVWLYLFSLLGWCLALVPWAQAWLAGTNMGRVQELLYMWIRNKLGESVKLPQEGRKPAALSTAFSTHFDSHTCPESWNLHRWTASAHSYTGRVPASSRCHYYHELRPCLLMLHWLEGRESNLKWAVNWPPFIKKLCPEEMKRRKKKVDVSFVDFIACHVCKKLFWLRVCRRGNCR